MYPVEKPRHTMFLDVGEGHRLYIEESGSHTGVPVVYLHGGPGTGSAPFARAFFDPARYRVILYDQRGAGKSTPHASLEANTTWHLVADLEKIRTALGIDRWLLFGGSWGSTLALAYAETHPDRVLGLILRGVFLCRDEDIQWFYQRGASRLFPEHWKDFVAPIPPGQRGDLVRAYHALLTGEDEVAQMRAAEAWARWEAVTSGMEVDPATVAFFTDPHIALSLARIECHYFLQRGFLEPDQLLLRADRLKGIPGTIIHGRYDCICPVEQAWLLHQVWPDSELQIVPSSGHSTSEPALSKALLAATDQWADKLHAQGGES